jgi:transposase
MWSNENRARYDRSRLRYPSDLTDAEWAHVEPLIPPAKRGGNRRRVDVRQVANVYVLGAGCQWRAVQKNRSTLYDYFDVWGWDGALEHIHEALYTKRRETAPREAGPTAAISVKGGEKGGAASTLRASTPARRSTARSATSWSIPRAC